MTEIGNRFNASVEATPQPGQWWVLNEKERRIHADPKSQTVFFCGKDAKGRMIFEDPDGNIEVDQGLDWRNWHHEPACTGWDWMPEVKTACKFVGKVMPKDVVEPEWANGESPDDWVTQDRVPERVGVDEWRFTYEPYSPSCWVLSGNGQASYGKHGDKVGVCRLEVRCRRKDLPVVEEAEKPKVATVTVYEVVYGMSTQTMYAQCLVGEETLQSLRHGWRYVSVVSTKTVEVML